MTSCVPGMWSLLAAGGVDHSTRLPLLCTRSNVEDLDRLGELPGVGGRDVDGESE